MNLPDLTDALLAAAKAAGADAADAMAVQTDASEVTVRAGKLEQAERAETFDFGLRVLVGQKQATVGSSDARSEVLAELAERAVAMAAEAPEDPYLGLADADQLTDQTGADGLDLWDASAEPDPAQLETWAREAEAGSMAVEGVTKTDYAAAQHRRSHVHLAASNGFQGGYGRTYTSVLSVAISGEGTGMERDGYGDGRVYAADLEDATQIGRTAGEMAVAMQGARKPQTGVYPVVYDERIASSLVGHLLAASNGAAVARGSSWLKDELGSQVLPEGLSVTEDPLRPRGLGSRPFDAEGLASQPRAIVENGILKGWTLDLANARKLGMQSTASAARSPSGTPSPTVTNIALTQGDQSRADLLRDMGTGLLITSMIGSTINANTGDYSRGASGFWVENGEIAYPVNECTVAGNLRDMLLRIVPANDAKLHETRVVPSILIDGMTLAGS